MTKGIVLIVWGDRRYYMAAYNFAFSLKYHSPNIKIFIQHDSGYEKALPDKSVFDFDELIPDNVLKPQGRIEPAFIKLSMYDCLPFDYNLYLDVDALSLHDIEPYLDYLIDKGGHYYTHVVDTHTLDKGNVIPNMWWADANTIWGHYNLPKDTVLPAINSSFQFIKKCDESKRLFDKAKENYSNPIPLKDLRNQWGGEQPDELYMNIALSQLGVNAKTDKDFLFMACDFHSGKLTLISDKYPLLCLFGHRKQIKSRYSDWYDDSLIKWQRIKGGRHIYKWHNIVASKHANNKRVKFPQEPVKTIHQAEKISTENKITSQSLPLKWKTEINLQNIKNPFDAIALLNEL